MEDDGEYWQYTEEDAYWKGYHDAVDGFSFDNPFIGEDLYDSYERGFNDGSSDS